MITNLRFGSKIFCAGIVIASIISIYPNKDIRAGLSVPERVYIQMVPMETRNSEAVPANIIQEGPTKFSLEPAYPNPFNGYVVIPFTILENGEYRLEIRNVLGEKIKELSYKAYAPGKYSVTWNGLDEDNNSVPSGIYFARLSTNEQLAKIQKLVYLK